MGFAPPFSGPPPGPALPLASIGGGGFQLGPSLGPAPILPVVDFTISLPALSLCGFSLPNPLIKFKIGISLPPLPFPFTIPIPYLAIFLTCSLSNPLSVSAGIPYGGGRKPNADPDPDMLEQALAEAA